MGTNNFTPQRTQADVDSHNSNIAILNHFGQEALRALLLLNGGASIASLTFIGTLAVNSKASTFAPVDMVPMLCFFGIGAGLAVMAYCLNYIIIATSLAFSPKAGTRFRVATIVTATLALVAYFAGLWAAGSVFLK